MLEVLLDPDGFFESMKSKSINLKLPALIVLVSGLIGGITTFMTSSMVLRAMSPTLSSEARMILSYMPIGSAIAAVGFSFVIWLIVAVILFGISSIFNGEGEFKRTLEFVGYGYIPTIINGLISAVIVYQFITTTHIPTISDPMAIAKLMKTPMIQISSVLGMLFVLWSANIWIFGLKHARNLSTRNAFITVAIPVAAYMLYSIYSMMRI